MSSDDPPNNSFNGIGYNPLFYRKDTVGITKAAKDTYYLSKQNSDTSTAPLTTFNNEISVGGTANFNSSVLLNNRYKIFEMLNIESDTTIILSAPLSQTYVIRTTSVPTTAITITLPNLSSIDVGFIVNFVKFKGTNNLAVTLNGNAHNVIPLNEIATLGSITNTTLLSVDKQMTSLMIAFNGTSYYWLEISNYSTFDRDYNNSIYPRLATANTFTNDLIVKTKLDVYIFGAAGSSWF